MAFLQINFQHLIIFYFVALSKSFSKACEKLGVTQPAVHQQVRALELRFGVKLVYVQKQQLHLTKTGEKLFAYAAEFFNQTTMTENFLKSCRLNNLRIGIATSLSLYMAPIIDKFKTSYPSVQITLREGPSIVIGQGLINLEHDICLIGSLNEFAESLRVVRIPVLERMVFVVGPDHPLTNADEVKWEDLAEYPLTIQSVGSMAREILTYKLREKGLEPNIVTETDSLECIRRLTRSGRRVSLMFLPNVRDDLALGSLKTVSVANEEIRLGIDILVNPELAESRMVKAFLKITNKHFQQEPNCAHQAAGSAL